MTHLIDSDIVIDHLENVADASQLLEHLAPLGISISIITYMETYQGRLRSPDVEAAITQFNAFLRDVPVLPFSTTAARACAQLQHSFSLQGKRVRPRALDLMTAAIALEHGLTLVTRNVADYDDIPGLSLHRW